MRTLLAIICLLSLGSVHSETPACSTSDSAQGSCPNDRHALLQSRSVEIGKTSIAEEYGTLGVSSGDQTAGHAEDSMMPAPHKHILADEPGSLLLSLESGVGGGDSCEDKFITVCKTYAHLCNTGTKFSGGAKIEDSCPKTCGKCGGSSGNDSDSDSSPSEKKKDKKSKTDSDSSSSKKKKDKKSKKKKDTKKKSGGSSGDDSDSDSAPSEKKKDTKKSGGTSGDDSDSDSSSGSHGDIRIASIELGAKIVANKYETNYLLSGRGRPEQPMKIRSASCGNRVFVAWTSEGSAAYITELLDGAGGLTMVESHKIGWCSEAGGVTASKNCEIVALLCRSSKGPSNIGAVDVIGRQKNNPPTGWYNTASDRDDHMYLVEWKSSASHGGLQGETRVHVNAAIGGWEYGEWDVAVDSGSTLDDLQYFLSIKATAMQHEGEVSMLLARKGWELKKHDWACGTGHVQRNRVTYNAKLDVFARFCRTDGTWSCNEEGAVPGECGMGSGTFYTTEPGNGRAAQLMGTDIREGSSDKGNGGAQNMVANGDDGFLGSGLGPAGPRLPVTVGLIAVPGSQEAYDYTKDKWMYLDLQDTDEDMEVEGSGIGFVNLQRIGNEEDDRFLLGYATGVKNHLVTGKYHLQEVTSTGCLLGDPLVLEGGGWGEDDLWTRLEETGCVAMPFTWDAGGKAGGKYSGASKLQVTTYCPRSKSPAGKCENDIDECARGIDDCSKDATCTNIRNRVGGAKFFCACKKGFEGDGKSCRRMYQSGVRIMRGEDGLGAGAVWYTWDVQSLELYSDKGCKNRIDVKGTEGTPLGSSWFDGNDAFSPAAALGLTGGFFGGRIDPEIEDEKVIWLGAAWRKSQSVHCAKLRQEKSGAKKVRVQMLSSAGVWETKATANVRVGTSTVSW